MAGSTVESLTRLLLLISVASPILAALYFIARLGITLGMRLENLRSQIADNRQEIREVQGYLARRGEFIPRAVLDKDMILDKDRDRDRDYPEGLNL